MDCDHSILSPYFAVLLCDAQFGNTTAATYIVFFEVREWL